MRLGRRLTRAFFERPSCEVGREIIGAVLVRRLPDGTRLAGRIVEVEAYVGDGSDPAAHSHAGRTPRNATMFGPAGRLYAYRSYGVHTCVNVVCEPPGSAAAILLRALEPLEGLDTMRRNRGLPANAPLTQLARGPGRLSQALGLGLGHDGVGVLGGEIELRARHASDPVPAVEAGPRVGITKAVDLPYRFSLRGSRFVSPFRSGVLRGRPATGR